ncbi:lipopolysaccharide transport periplasmic protein LptA [Cognatishimia maritima]|uniref:Lipopolysaccharide export system protein LptA n=1 Tax=Cognatishimia maritima TaxID=870908 RepID=A0A1M5P580_9RHOB|nr:lipopolysaccharide transport periplasmic protein LptA [Cognatishimia maritima]SHG96908.1 lipopolysaccharide export system protein LptA [Cognatishimia maritima]
MLRFSAIVLALVFAAAAYAQEFKVNFGLSNGDPNAPIEVEADSLSVDQATGNAVFTGNVIITQSDMSFRAALVEVTYLTEDTGIAKLTGSGGVALQSGNDTAQAETAVYDVESGLIHMTGNVSLAQRGNTITAQRMTVNTANSTAELHGRVRTVLQPAAN